MFYLLPDFFNSFFRQAAEVCPQYSPASRKPLSGKQKNLY